MRKKHKKVCRTLNYFKHSLLFISAVTGCPSISNFALQSLQGIKKYKSIIKKRETKCDKKVLIAKTKSYVIEVFISKALINS